MLSRVNTLEEGKGGPKNDTEERAKIESALTSLHQRISELEKGNRQGRAPAPGRAPSARGTVPGLLASCSNSPELLYPSSHFPPLCSPLPPCSLVWASNGCYWRGWGTWALAISVEASPPHTRTRSQGFPESDLFKLQ